MIPEKSVTLAPEGILDEKAIKSLLAEIAFSRMPRATIDCSGIRLLLAEAVVTLKSELDNYGGSYVEIEFVNLVSEMALQFQLYDFPVEDGRVKAAPQEASRGEINPSVPKAEGKISFLCRQCKQTLRVHYKGLHACPNCGSKLYVDTFGRTKYYEPLRLFQR